MDFHTADRINTAAFNIGMYLLGVNPRPLAAEHLQTIRDVTLAQMQTAKDVIQAHNARQSSELGVRMLYSVPDDDLLAEIKAAADAPRRVG